MANNCSDNEKPAVATRSCFRSVLAEGFQWLLYRLNNSRFVLALHFAWLGFKKLHRPCAGETFPKHDGFPAPTRRPRLGHIYTRITTSGQPMCASKWPLEGDSSRMPSGTRNERPAERQIPRNRAAARPSRRSGVRGKTNRSSSNSQRKQALSLERPLRLNSGPACQSPTPVSGRRSRLVALTSHSPPTRTTFRSSAGFLSANVGT